MVLLSSIASRAPATPSFSAGCSTSDSVDLVPATTEIADADLDRVGRERLARDHDTGRSRPTNHRIMLPPDILPGLTAGEELSLLANMTDLSGLATPHLVVATSQQAEITIMRALICFAALLLMGSPAPPIRQSSRCSISS